MTTTKIISPILVLFIMLISANLLAADANKLYGIHWWGYSGSLPIDDQPAQLLDSVTESAWDLETVVTDSDPWWQASWFVPLYNALYNEKNVTIITRIDYNWGTTIPSSDYSAWADSVVNNVVNVLKDYCHIWVIGNEMNIVGEGTGFPGGQIQPTYYVEVYKTVRQRIHDNALVGAPGAHIVLLGPVSPGGVIPGVRWMSGNDYLIEMLELLQPDEVDGFAIHAYGWNISEFHGTYTGQLAIIDGYGFQSKPVFMTEWNRYTDTGNEPDEENTANFIRDAFQDIRDWNASAGNHNVVCMTWFVYDADDQAGGAWNGYAIEYWKDHGYSYGDSRDIYTAFEQTVDLRYPAGSYGGGAPSPPSQPYVDEFEGTTMASYWNIHNPDDPSIGTEDSVSVADGYLQIYINGYDDDIWTARGHCPFVYLQTPVGDWAAEIWFEVDGGISLNHKAGFFITNNPSSTNNCLFVTMRNSSDWDDGVIGSVFVSGTHNWIGADIGASQQRCGLKIARQGTQFTVYYRQAPQAQWQLLPPGGVGGGQNPRNHPNLDGQVYLGMIVGAWPNNNGTPMTAQIDYFGSSWNPAPSAYVNTWFLYH